MNHQSPTINHQSHSRCVAANPARWGIAPYRLICIAPVCLTTNYQLTSTGLVTNKIYADGRGPWYNYSDDGKLIERKWARGVTTTYAYDGWNNLIERYAVRRVRL